MKRIVKITAISVASIVALIALVVGAALYIVLTPERLTPIVESQAKEQMGLDISIESVDLVIFSTFPELQMRVRKFNFAPVAQIDSMCGVVDVKRLMGGEVVLKELSLHGANFDVCTDTLARMGLYDPTPAESAQAAEPTESAAPMTFDQTIIVENISVNDLMLKFADSDTQIEAQMTIPKFNLSGSLQESKVAMQMAGSIILDRASMADSVVIEGVNLSEMCMAMNGSMDSNIYEVDATAVAYLARVALNEEVMLADANMTMTLPATIDVDAQQIDMRKATFALNDLSIAADGYVKNQADNNLLADLHLVSNRWEYSSIVPLIPAPYRADIESMTRSGGAVQADLRAFVDLSQAQKSNISITDAKMELGSNRVALNGLVDDALGDITCDFNINARASIAELMTFVPESMDLNMKASGIVNGNVSTQFRLEDVTANRIEKVRARGRMVSNNLKVKYNDSINMVNNRAQVDFVLAKKRNSNHILDMKVAGSKVDYAQIGVGEAALVNPWFNVSMSNPMDTTRVMSAVFDYDVADLKFKSDSISAHLLGADGRITMSAQSERPKDPVMAMKYHSDSMAVAMVGMVDANMGDISVEAHSEYDSTQESPLLQWNPLLNVDFNNGAIKMAQVEPVIYIPTIKFDYRSEDMEIYDSRIVIEDSDFALSGYFGNIRSYIEGEKELLGELNYHSKMTNLDQLMALSQSFTAEAEPTTVQPTQSQDTVVVAAEPNPFMIPKRVNVKLNTEINKALFNDNSFFDIKGDVVASDGELIMDQVGFKSDAARMFLTAIYRPERANHLYTGFNFHLIDIDIDALVDLIPEVDSLMPMLRDFEGKGEFHVAAEGYLNGFYEPKMSTLRGAMAIKGEDLVLLDSETFSQMSKMLLFSKKARNVVDSLSVEATLFRNEVELYPFLISMDRWQGVISGRHNVDMNFDYHVSVVDCPVPVKLGLDIKGNFDDMKFNLAPCKYKTLYKPNKQGAVDKQINDFKSIVSNSLIENLKRREDYKSELKK